MGASLLTLPAVLLTRGACDVPAVQIMLFSLLDVILGPLWVWLFLGEALTVTTSADGTLIVTAVVLASITGRERAPVAIIRVDTPAAVV
jgi:DME family drug/metabolite transporter